MENELMRINANGVLTIPVQFRRKGFAVNHYVNVSLEEDGSLRITPVEAIPTNQLGFHTRPWLEKERKASRDLQNGKVKTYKTRKAFLKDLAKW